eukprot:Gb_07397 [translate_table: standard]
MELESENSGSANEGKKVEEERHEMVEEMAKLKEEGIKTNGLGADQVEKPKGVGLKKWKRRRREPTKDGGHAQESQRMLKRGPPIVPHVGKSPASKGISGGNKIKNQEGTGSESSVGNVASSSLPGFVHPDRMSDSGSWNAMVNVFPFEADFSYGRDQDGKSSSGKSESSVRQELLNEIGFVYVKDREETKCPPVYEGGIPVVRFDRRKPDLRAFAHREGKRLVESTKKARAEKNAGNKAERENPVHEHEENGTDAGKGVHICEEISGNHVEDVHASSLPSGSKEESSHVFGGSCWSIENNSGGSQGSGSSRGKAMLAKKGSFLSLNNGRLLGEELKLWHENFEPECSTCERQNSEEAQIVDSDVRRSVSHDRFTEVEEVRENSVSNCEDIMQSEESFASAVNTSEKKREEIVDSGRPANRMHLEPKESDCLVQALTQLQTAQDAFQKEVQQIKDLGNGIQASWMTNSEYSTNFATHTEIKNLHEFVGPDVYNAAHLGEKGEMNWSSWESQLNKLNQKLKLTEEELEAARQKISAEELNVQELKVLCADQAVKLKEIEMPRDRTASAFQSLEEKCQEMETELEEQYKEKMQAEIEFVILTEEAENGIALVENEASILQEQKGLVIEQLQTALKLKDAQGRALALKNQIKELESVCGSLLETEEVLTLHNKVCGFSLWSFIQFILLCFSILFMFAQFPNTPDLVPT